MQRQDLGGEDARVHRRRVDRVDQHPRRDQRGGPARALVGLGEAADRVEVHRCRGSQSGSRCTATYAWSAETAFAARPRRRRPRSAAGRASAPARAAAAPAAASGARAGRGTVSARRSPSDAGAGSTPPQAARPSRSGSDDVVGEDPLGDDERLAVQRRASAHPCGRRARCRRPACRPVPVRHSVASAATASSPSHERGSSQSTSPAFAPSVIRGSVRVVAVAVEVVEPQHREPEPSGEVGLARARGPGQDDHLRRHVAHHAVAGSGMRTRFGLLAVVVAAPAHGGARRRRTHRRRRPREPTTDADCVTSIPDEVFTTLGWTPTADGATSTVRGCRRQASQGYVEVRRRAASYDQVCATLDRTGGVSPGVPAPWLGADVTACAVEPDATAGSTSARPRWCCPTGRSRSCRSSSRP